MTLEYKEDKILKKEEWNFGPLLGYINPYGNIIDLSMLVGEVGHDNWRNPVTPTFIRYISFVLLNTDAKELISIGLNNELYNKNSYTGFKEIVKRGVDFGREINYQSYTSFKKNLDDKYEKEKKKFQSFLSFDVKNGFKSFYEIDVYQKLVYDLVCLFHKTYSDNDFFDSIGIIPKVLDKATVVNTYKRKFSDDITGFEDDFYYEYLMIQLMSYLKDICVQYLGYHSLERAIPCEDLNLFNNINKNSYGYTFSESPRTITTSEPNVNDTFYNWLLMNWEIQRVPRYYWNENQKRFELESETLKFYETEKEEILGKEIGSIKRLVPLEERYKYFR